MGGCNQYTKCSREELPHVQGQGQKPGGPDVRRMAAKTSYSTSEVRGSGQEYQAVTVQEWPRGAILHPRSGPAVRRNYPLSEARGGGREELTCVQGQGRRPRGATLRSSPGAEAGGANPCPKPGAAAGRSNPSCNERWLHRCRRA